MSAFADQINLFTHLTPKKAANAARIISSFYRSKWAKTPIHQGLPISLSFEPTTACNLACPECPSGLKQFSRPTGNLTTDFFKKTIKELADHLVYLTFYFQGEPYINPQFLDMVSYAGQHGIYTATSTNAHFLDDKNAKKTIESGLDRLIISIDGTTQETYESYRIKGDLSKVIEGTRNVISWKRKLQSKTPHIIFQFLVVKPNEHQIEDVKKMGMELGVDEVKFKTAQIYDYKNGNELIPSITKYSRYRKQSNGKFRINNALENHCWRLWQSCVITWDGLVVPCCFDKDATHQLGDLKRNTFKEIWQGEPYQKFRAAVLRARSEIDICTNCTEGTKVWA